jgi:hypothetical protein
MTYLSSLDIEYSAEDISIKDVLQFYLTAGWNLDDHGKITFLPVGDKGDFKWSKLELSEVESLYSAMDEKETCEEIIGVVLMWKKSMVGVTGLFYRDRKISFVLNVNRKQLRGCDEYTDVNWYIQRIIPPLISGGVNIISAAWQEYPD